MSTIDKIKEFISEATSELTSREDELQKILQTLVSQLEQSVKLLDMQGIIIQGRVKSTNSLQEKIIRKNYHTKYMNIGEDRAQLFVDGLPDLIGVRIVCLLNSEEEIIFKHLKESFTEKSTDTVEDFFYSNELKSQNDNGYLSMCLSNQPEKQKNGKDIYRIACKWYNRNEGRFINIELQIKSLTHLFWGELEHMLFYKNYAYIVANDFYHEIIMHVENELKNIDGNLLRLTQQIKKNDFSQTKEIKQIAGMFLYTKYSLSIKQILDFDTDIRTVCDLIVDMYFKQPPSHLMLFDKLSEFISKVNDSNDLTSFDDISNEHNADQDDISNKGQYFAGKVESLIKSSDLTWVIFYKIFSIVHEFKNHTTIIKNISENFAEMLKPFEDSFPAFENDGVDVLVRRCTYSALSKAFSEYEKMDFFVYNTNLNSILDRFKFFFECNEDTLASIDSEKFDDICEFIEEYLKYVVMATCHMNISKDKIVNIMKLIENSGLIEIPFESDKYSMLIANKSIINPTEFFEIFPYQERV